MGCKVTIHSRSEIEQIHFFVVVTNQILGRSDLHAKFGNFWNMGSGTKQSC